MGKAVAKKPATKKGGKCGGKGFNGKNTKGCKYGGKGFKGENTKGKGVGAVENEEIKKAVADQAAGQQQQQQQLQQQQQGFKWKWIKIARGMRNGRLVWLRVGDKNPLGRWVHAYDGVIPEAPPCSSSSSSSSMMTVAR